MSDGEQGANSQPKRTVSPSRRCELTHRAIDAIFGNTKINQTEEVCEVCGQKHQPFEPCIKTATAEGAAQPATNNILELINNVKSIQETQQQILAQAEQKAKNYAEKLTKVRLAAAKRTARVKSELETKARDYADSIIRAKAEASEALTKQKGKMESEAAEKVARVKSQAADEISKLQLQLEKNAKAYESLLNETEEKKQIQQQKKNEIELKLQATGERISLLEEQLIAAKQILQHNEDTLKEEQEARAYAEQKAGLAGQELVKAQQLAQAEAKDRDKIQEQLRSLNQQLEQIKTEAAAQIAKIKTDAAEMLERAKAESIKEIAQLKTELQQKVQSYETILEESERLLGSSRQEVTQLQGRLRALEEAKHEAELKLEHQEQAISAAKEEIKTLREKAKASETTGTCECCGRDNIKEIELVRIDSGQLFCPDCLKALRGG